MSERISPDAGPVLRVPIHILEVTSNSYPVSAGVTVVQTPASRVSQGKDGNVTVKYGGHKYRAKPVEGAEAVYIGSEPPQAYQTDIRSYGRKTESGTEEVRALIVYGQPRLEELHIFLGKSLELEQVITNGFGTARLKDIRKDADQKKPDVSAYGFDGKSKLELNGCSLDRVEVRHLGTLALQNKTIIANFQNNGVEGITRDDDSRILNDVPSGE